MDTFVPPGYMTLGELAELTGQALYKDDWRGSTSVAAELEHRREIMGLVRLSRNRPYGRPVPSPREIAAKASARREEYQRMREQYRHAVATLRAALCTDALRAGRLLLTGHIVEVPPYFWRGAAAEAEFLVETPVVMLELDPHMMGHFVVRGAETGR
jgi:hypothetical protein